MSRPGSLPVRGQVVVSRLAPGELAVISLQSAVLSFPAAPACPLAQTVHLTLFARSASNWKPQTANLTAEPFLIFRLHAVPVSGFCLMQCRRNREIEDCCRPQTPGAAGFCPLSSDMPFASAIMPAAAPYHQRLFVPCAPFLRTVPSNRIVLFRPALTAQAVAPPAPPLHADCLPAGRLA